MYGWTECLTQPIIDGQSTVLNTRLISLLIDICIIKVYGQIIIKYIL